MQRDFTWCWLLGFAHLNTEMLGLRMATHVSPNGNEAIRGIEGQVSVVAVATSVVVSNECLGDASFWRLHL